MRPYGNQMQGGSTFRHPLRCRFAGRRLPSYIMPLATLSRPTFGERRILQPSQRRPGARRTSLFGCGASCWWRPIRPGCRSRRGRRPGRVVDAVRRTQSVGQRFHLALRVTFTHQPRHGAFRLVSAAEADVERDEEVAFFSRAGRRRTRGSRR